MPLIEKRLLHNSKYSRIGRGIDRLSSFYDTISFVLSFGKVQRCSALAASLVKEAQQIAVFGGGTGGIIPHLRYHHPDAMIDFYEVSEKMIKSATRYSDDKIKFILAESAHEDSNYDLIIFPFILNCLSGKEILHLVSNVLGQSKPDAKIIVADFSVKSSSYLQRLYVKLLYFGFRILVPIRTKSLPNYEQLILTLGLLSEKELLGKDDWYQVSLYSKANNNKPGKSKLPS